MRRILAAAALLSATAAFAQDAANGEALYRRNCINCHGFPPLRGPDGAAYNPDMIRTAITSKVARMRFLSFLTDAQLVDIAMFIGRTLGIPARPGLDYTDLWWNPDEPGWGLSVVQHGGAEQRIFATLYTYDANGRPLWLVLPAGEWLTPLVFAGDLYRTSGPAPLTVRRVGTMKISFAAAPNTTATLSYSVDGVAVEKALRRQPF